MKENNKKGISRITVILIIMIILICVAVGIFVLNKFNHTNYDKNDVNNNPNVNESSSNATLWDEYEIVIDGISIKLPMTHQEFLNKGFYQEAAYSTEVTGIDISSYKLEPDLSMETALPMLGYATFTNGKTDNISIVVYNPTNEQKLISESYVVGISLKVEPRFGDITIGEFKIKNNTRKTEIIMNKSTVDQISELFGDKHYIYRNENEFTYLPDKNGDGIINTKDVDGKKMLYLYCDSDTNILIPNNFLYNNFGDLQRQ